MIKIQSCQEKARRSRRFTRGHIIRQIQIGKKLITELAQFLILSSTEQAYWLNSA